MPLVKYLPDLRGLSMRLYPLRSPVSPSIAILLCLLFGSNVSAQCKPADAQTANMIRYMRQLATATVPADSESVKLRSTYGIPAATANQVLLVTTTRTCQSALSAFRTAAPDVTPSPTSVYVVAVGSVYVVWATRPAQSEWTPHVVFTSKFQVLSQFAG